MQQHIEGQRLELIDGDLIDKTRQSPPRAYVIQVLGAILGAAFGPRLRTQLPIEPAPDEREWSLPEPDLAVVAEFDPRWSTQHPTGPDTVLVVEVADTTLRHDASLKRDLYARARVPEYWIVDIPGRCAIVHRRPEAGVCREATTHESDSSIAPACEPNAIVALSYLLP
ncbi:MAG: Uma2 family endonuclease [Bryobacteraceae bacterium]